MKSDSIVLKEPFTTEQDVFSYLKELLWEATVVLLKVENSFIMLL